MAFIYEDNIISFVAHSPVVDIHKHHCFQILLSLSSPFSSTIHGQCYERRGLINQQVTHACNATSSSVLVYFVDAESRTGWHLKQILDGQAFVDLGDFWTQAIPESVEACSRSQLQTIAHEALSQVLIGNPEPAQRDERVTRAIFWLEQNVQQKITLQAVADYIALSPERTRHLFAAETGVSFSQFLLWKRIKHAIVLAVRDGASLTNAALESGFADQAHFCRLFKRTFGVSARALLKNSRNVQFLSPSF
jgi:AraC-like DNA-binding protein